MAAVPAVATAIDHRSAGRGMGNGTVGHVQAGGGFDTCANKGTKNGDAIVTPSAGSAASSSSAPMARPQPQNGYARFRDMLKHPSAQPVIAHIRDFVIKFPDELPRAEAASRVHSFLSSTQEWMLTRIVVFAADADEEGRADAAEGLEKFVLSRLYPKLFGTDPSDAAEDDELSRRIACLQWVDFGNLGVPPVSPTLLQLAVSELRRIDNYKAPRDKLVVVLNVSRVINDVLKRTRAMESFRPLSADDFLPLLIYAVIKAHAPRLHSNVEFIAAFRHPSRLVLEDAYFLTALQSAVAFVRVAGPKVLEVTPQEFHRLCEESAAAMRAGANTERWEVAAGEKAAVERDSAPNDRATPSTSTVAEMAASLSQEQRARIRVRLASLPRCFDSVESARQLRVADAKALVEAYAEVARLLRQVDSGAPVD